MVDSSDTIDIEIARKTNSKRIAKLPSSKHIVKRDIYLYVYIYVYIYTHVYVYMYICIYLYGVVDTVACFAGVIRHKFKELHELLLSHTMVAMLCFLQVI